MAGVIALAPFSAFAGSFIAAGDINQASTSSQSMAGVQSDQGTWAKTGVGGNGAVVLGTVSGNYTTVNTQGQAKAGPGGSSTSTQAQQFNIGGTISGGVADNGKHGTANGVTGGGQNSQAVGGSTASASNNNVGGFVVVKSYHH
jgi:hypothetical protein